jgi:DNA-binding response OmpR family regulator
MRHTIQLVDNDEPTTTYLADQLTTDGYTPTTAATAQAAYHIAERAMPDAVPLGDLPDRRETIALLDEIRTGGRLFDADTPVIVLSEHHTAPDVVRALDHGADDVIAKPADYRELRARLGTQLQRRGHRRAGEVLRVRDLEIDTRARLVVLAGDAIALTQREYTLLVHLARDPERVFTKAELTEQLWGYPEGCTTRTLDSTQSACAASSLTTATTRGFSTCGASATRSRRPATPTRRAPRTWHLQLKAGRVGLTLDDLLLDDGADGLLRALNPSSIRALRNLFLGENLQLAGDRKQARELLSMTVKPLIEMDSTISQLLFAVAQRLEGVTVMAEHYI